MSNAKGAANNSAQFLKQPEDRSFQDIEIPPRRQAARSQRAANRWRPVATVMAAVVAIAVGDGVWGARTATAAPHENYAVANAMQIGIASASDPSSALLLAQDQASAAPQQSSDENSPPPESQLENPAPAAPAPHPRAISRSVLDEHASSDLSEYLHQHHLPFVDAMVFSNASGRPTLVKLSGQVRTDRGKEDAETKSSDFLNASGVRIQNHIEVDPTIASTAAAPSSASSVPASNVAPAIAAAPAATADPCTDLCLKDEGHCNTACQTQAAGGATSGGFSVQAIMSQFGSSATAMKQCNDQCLQTREHCTYQCQTASSEPPPSEGADSGSPPPDVSDHQAEGPDTPPE
ncbi:hypothetical protein [Candidatus Binatus sp.]|jgi:hypothetical protein|uniref:hypothetical protein n=1 Tax=Candidatus Binatus sp. TaxID=2811406 RepID=UPI003C8A7346